ncbi:hypothetical protein DFP73DRAFT_324652 [Morchella snyderi]|nr:hypothetical protein DFP73DRAFT_324652 [Morchella snyderi]
MYADMCSIKSNSFSFFILFLILQVAYIPHRRQTDDPAGRYEGLGGGGSASSPHSPFTFPPHVLVPETLSTGDPEVPGSDFLQTAMDPRRKELLRQRLLGDERPHLTGPSYVERSLLLLLLICKLTFRYLPGPGKSGQVKHNTNTGSRLSPY